MKNLLCLLLLLPSFVRAQTISIVASADAVCAGTAVHFTATPAGTSSPHYKWQVNGATAGSDSSGFTTTALSNGDSVKCLLTNAAGDTIFDISNGKRIVVDTMPDAGIITGYNKICLGESITLSASVPGGIWAASNTNASVFAGIVKGLEITRTWDIPVGPSVDTIYYILTNSCGSDSTSIVDTIFPIPHAGFTVSSSLCVGSSVIVNHGGGLNGSLYSMYGYTSPYGDYILGIKKGNDIIVNVWSNYCGIDTFRNYITVGGPPDTILPIIASATKACIGELITLSDSTKNLSFSWRLSNDNAVFKNYGVVGVKPGLDTINLYGSNACGTKKASLAITIEPPLPIKTTGPLCLGRQVTFYDSSGGGVWNNTNHLIASVGSSSGIVTAITTGIDTVTYTLPNGCSAKTTITVNPLPASISGDDLLCTGERVTLFDTGNSSWLSHDSEVIKINGYYHTVQALGKGTGIIRYSLNTGCYDSFIVRVFDCNTYVSIFPNPTKADIIVQVDTIQFNHLSITTLSGQILLGHPITDTFTKVSVRSLPPGMYILYLSGGHGMTYYSKLIKD